VSFHEELVDRRGPGWQAFWGSQDSQRVRYQVLLDQLPLHGRTVLEVGCGFGDFLDYAGARGVVPQRYLGVDLSARIIAGARERHPGAEFAVLDVLQSDPPLSPDFIIASGIMAVAVEGYADYVLETLRRFHSVGRVGFGCNFLSTCTARPDGVSQYVEPTWLLGLFQRHIDWRCRLIHDYRPNDFTLIHLRG
jgi:SAM-dependent methyltransferase